MGKTGDLPARAAIPLAFLYTRNRAAIEGATRFQKLVFLAQEESELPSEYEYQPDNFGPFSPTLRSDLRMLMVMGLVEKEGVENEVGNEVHVFRLTREGMQTAAEFAERDVTGRIFDSAKEVKQEWGQKRLDRLVQYVYGKYDEYTTDSKLDTERLHDPDSRSQFLEPSEADYVGPSPGEFMKLNPSAEELFSTE